MSQLPIAHQNATPDIRFVDAHHHLYDLDANYYPWLCDVPPPNWIFGNSSPLRRNYRVETYIDDVTQFGVAKSVHVEVGWNPADPVGETEWLQSIADRTGFPHGIVGQARLEREDIEQVLEQHLRFANIRGIRQNLNWHDNPIRRLADRPDYMNDSKWRRGFSLLRRHDLSFDLQLFHHQMGDAYNLAREFPDTRLILNHGGMLIERDTDAISAWRVDLERLAQAPNVAVKVSGLGLGHPGWTDQDIRPLVLTLIDLFGPSRCMFGTDLPVDAMYADLSQIFGSFRRLCSAFSPAEQKALCAETAEKWYRI